MQRSLRSRSEDGHGHSSQHEYVPPLNWQRSAFHRLAEEDLAFVNNEHVYGHSCSMVKKPDDVAASAE